MANRNEQDGISRREFATRVGAAAAGIAVGGELFGSQVQASPHVSGRILGANDRVVTASIGIRGQGNSLKRGFARLANVEIKTLCDIDANLAASRINDEKLADVSTFKPAFVQDLRRVLDGRGAGRNSLRQDPWHRPLAVAYGIVGAAADQGCRYRARQQDCQNGLGHDG